MLDTEVDTKYINSQIHPSNTHKVLPEEGYPTSVNKKQRARTKVNTPCCAQSAPKGSLPRSCWTTLSYFSSFLFLTTTDATFKDISSSSAEWESLAHINLYSITSLLIQIFRTNPGLPTTAYLIKVYKSHLKPGMNILRIMQSSESMNQGTATFVNFLLASYHNKSCSLLQRDRGKHYLGLCRSVPAKAALVATVFMLWDLFLCLSK